MRVCVTGFGSFPGVDSNPTELLLERLSKDPVPGPEFLYALLPVSYLGSFVVLEERLRVSPSELMVHLGVSAKDNTLRLETRAFNWMQAKVPDNDGVHHRGVVLDPAVPPQSPLESTIPLSALHEALLSRGIEVSLSQDPGRYVCNALYYQSLRRAANQNPAQEVVFVHVPQVGNLSPTSSTWTLDRIERGVRELLRWFATRA